MCLKHDDLYARAWECDYEPPTFHAENNNAMPLTSTEFSVQSDGLTEEMRNTPGTAHERSPDKFPPREEFYEGTDSYPDTEPDVQISSEQPNSSPTNPGSCRYNLCHNPKPNYLDDYR